MQKWHLLNSNENQDHSKLYFDASQTEKSTYSTQSTAMWHSHDTDSAGKMYTMAALAGTKQ